MVYDEIGISIEDSDLSYEELMEIEKQDRERWARLQVSFPEEARLKMFNDRSFLTKEAVVADIGLEIAALTAQAETATGEQQRYLTAKRDFFKRFTSEVQSTVLFEKLEPWWAYRYRYNSRGATLELAHIDYRQMMIYKEGDFFCLPDTVIPAVRTDAKTMTVEEYATYTGKTEAAIRQGLRRGKYRSAFKVGPEWRISELCLPSAGQRYKPAQYEWRSSLAGVPEGFEYLKAPGFVDISRDDDDRQSFSIYVHPWEDQGKNTRHFYRLSSVEKERLELFLISNPMVEVKDDEKIYDIRRK